MEETRVALPHSPRPGEVFELEVTGFDGDGVGTAKILAAVGPGGMHKTYTFKVPRAVPGDSVRFDVRGYRRGVVSGWGTVVAPSPDRVEAACPHFDGGDGMPGCGGCRLQGLSYQHQLDVKRGWLVHHFAAAGLETTRIDSVRATESPWYYRNKMELSFADGPDGAVALGLHPAGMKFDVIDVDHCRLLSPEAMSLAAAVRSWAQDLGLAPDVPRRRPMGFLRNLMIREGKRTGERMVVLVTTGAETITTTRGQRPAREVVATIRDVLTGTPAGKGAVDSAWWIQHRAERGQRTTRTEHHLMGAHSLIERLRIPGREPLEFEVQPASFVQPNTAGAEVLYGQVLELADLDHGSRVLDLYCGTGTIGLALAHRASQVVGVEIVEAAVEDARKNATRNGIDNASFLCGDVEDYLAGRDSEPVDAVVVDPPRAGLSRRSLDKLLTVGAERIVYVSCRPASLARDGAALVAGGYVLDEARPVDMFPHTAHLETVARFSRRTTGQGG